MDPRLRSLVREKRTPDRLRLAGAVAALVEKQLDEEEARRRARLAEIEAERNG